MENAELEVALEELESRLERLRALYEQYFMGIERIEPAIPRKDIDRRIYVLRREKIRVVFSEESFPQQLLAVLRGEAGVRVYTISHIASGAYTADKFEKEMQRNVDTMIEALVTAPRQGAPPGAASLHD